MAINPKTGRLRTTALIVEGERGTELEGTFLAVSRKDDYTSFTFPGGKTEGDEFIITCAVRELKEETGITAHSLDLVDVRDYDNKTVNPISRDEVWLYKVTKYSGDFFKTEELMARGEGVSAWVLPEDLIAGAFGDYNREIFKEFYGVEL